MQITELNFCHPGDDEALVVIPERNGDTVTVAIPNVLMQSGEDLMVYECVGDVTVSHVRKSVVHRERPADYAYTEISVPEEWVFTLANGKTMTRTVYTRGV
ncbi:MAG: hypothetical protein ACI3X2_09050 [Butyricicoccus porcorum]